MIMKPKLESKYKTRKKITSVKKLDNTIQKHILKTQHKSIKNVESEIKKLDLENFMRCFFLRTLSISRLLFVSENACKSRKNYDF